MADFMTVLAASQKQAVGGKQANPLLSLLPEHLFGNVLSAQLKQPPEALPAALADGVSLQLRSGDGKAELAAEVVTSQSAESPATAPATAPSAAGARVVGQDTQMARARPEAAVALAVPEPRPHAVASDTARLPLPRTRPPASAAPSDPSAVVAPAIAVTSLDPARQTPPATASASQVPLTRKPLVASVGAGNPAPRVPSAVAETLPAPAPQILFATSIMPLEQTPGLRPAALPARQGLIPAATPADIGAPRGQELPLVGRIPLDVRPEAMAPPALAVVATSVAPGLMAATDLSVDTAPTADPTGMNAARQLGHFEHVLRTPESRVQVALEAPVRSQAFPVEFSEKIVWLAGRQSQWAEMSLNPPQLGAVEVRLSLSGGEAGVQFFSPHPAVRDAIEAALPRLRELMAQAGLALGNAQVREEAFARRESGGSNQASGNRIPESPSFPASSIVMGAARAGIGLVDLYV